MKTFIVNGRVVTPHRVIPLGGVAVEDGKIIDVFSGSPELPEGAAVYDAAGAVISPGFIDTHVHGGGMNRFEGDSTDAIIAGAKVHMQFGTTTILPTSAACPFDEEIAFLESFAQAKASMTDGPNMPGVHMEGSYFNKAQAGAQDPLAIRDPVRAEYTHLLERFPGLILRWALAPELPGALEMARTITSHGIQASIGHSDAVYEQVLEAVDAGFDLVTHLYSGCSMTRRINAYRHPGVVESAYLIDALRVEVIADGKHLPPSLLKLIYKIKGPDRICLVTDGSEAAGAEGVTEARMGRETIIIHDGVAFLKDFSAFAGSVCTTNRLVRTMVQQAEVPLAHAVQMITHTPARMLGLDDKIGTLAKGLNADIVVFDDNIDVQMVFVGGRLLVDKRAAQ